MWNIAGTAIDVSRFQPFEPVEVLYDFDGPRIFTLTDFEGELHLAYWSDQDNAVCRYVVVPTTHSIVESLRQGRMNVFDALNQQRCWVCDVSLHGGLTACQRVIFDAVPRGALPAVGTVLMPNLD